MLRVIPEAEAGPEISRRISKIGAAISGFSALFLVVKHFFHSLFQGIYEARDSLDIHYLTAKNSTWPSTFFYVFFRAFQPDIINDKTNDNQ